MLSDPFTTEARLYGYCCCLATNCSPTIAVPQWRIVLGKEFQTLINIDNDTWHLVPRPSGANVVTGKWIYKHKFRSNGSLAFHRACWVVCSFSQQHGIDYDETLSPVVKPTTIHVIISIVASWSWTIHQLNVKNAFLNGNLDETVYCHRQPLRFIDPLIPDHVRPLQKSFNGLKQDLCAWHQRFAMYLCQLGFTSSATDASLLIYEDADNMLTCYSISTTSS